jgi:hypothetical protein
VSDVWQEQLEGQREELLRHLRLAADGLAAMVEAAGPPPEGPGPEALPAWGAPMLRTVPRSEGTMPAPTHRPLYRKL